HRCNGIRFPSANNGGLGAISFLWKWQGINAAKPVSGAIDTPVAGTQIAGTPDLEFVAQSMNNDLPPNATQVGYRIHVKNAGTARSRATDVRCEDVGEAADTTPGPTMGQIKPWRYTWTRAVPAINAGQSYSDTVEVLGAERLFSRRCTIDPQLASGERNRTNNTYERTISTALSAPIRPNVPGAPFTPKK
ncbi:MAG: hypothetical protein ACRDAM_05815, partial [Casimicrobium sp.]